MTVEDNSVFFVNSTRIIGLYIVNCKWNSWEDNMKILQLDIKLW
jgi:hypothetical protein